MEKPKKKRIYINWHAKNNVFSKPFRNLLLVTGAASSANYLRRLGDSMRGAGASPLPFVL